MQPFPIERVRGQFPALTDPSTVWLDNPAGTQVVTRMDYEGNVAPWLHLAKDRGLAAALNLTLSGVSIRFEGLF